MVTTSPSNAAEAVDRVKQSARLIVDAGVHRLDFRSMSTACQIKVHGAPTADATDFEREAVEWVGRFEGRYSRFIPDSLISRINAAAGEHWVEIDPETERLFNLCQELFFFTRGSFDPSALPLIQLWNWKERPVALPPAEAIETARELVGWNKIQRRPGGIFLPQRGMAPLVLAQSQKRTAAAALLMADPRVAVGLEARARGRRT